MKRPLVGLAILYGAGIWFGSVTTWPVEWWWASAAGLMAAFLLSRHDRLWVFGLVVVAGAVAYRSATSQSDP